MTTTDINAMIEERFAQLRDGTVNGNDRFFIKVDAGTTVTWTDAVGEQRSQRVNVDVLEITRLVHERAVASVRTPHGA